MSDRLTPEWLAEIRTRVEAASGGPWTADQLGDDGYQVPEPLVVASSDGDHLDEANAVFIAAARSDVPLLLAEIDALHTERDEVLDVLSEIDELRKKLAAAVREEALTMARGCHDYNGGHGGAEGEAYHHGIDTVVNVLTAWTKHRAESAPLDSQLAAVAERERDEAREQRDLWARQCNLASEHQADTMARASPLEEALNRLIVAIDAYTPWQQWTEELVEAFNAARALDTLSALNAKEPC